MNALRIEFRPSVRLCLDRVFPDLVTRSSLFLAVEGGEEDLFWLLVREKGARECPSQLSNLLFDYYYWAAMVVVVVEPRSTEMEQTKETTIFSLFFSPLQKKFKCNFTRH